MVLPSDSSPWVPPDESMELQRYNARKRGIVFPIDQAQGDPKHQDTSSSTSSSSPLTSIPPSLPEFTTPPIPPVPSTPSDPLAGSLRRWQAIQPLASDSPFTFPRVQRQRTTPPVGSQRSTNVRHIFNSTRPPLALLRPPAPSGGTSDSKLSTFVVKS